MWASVRAPPINNYLCRSVLRRSMASTRTRSNHLVCSCFILEMTFRGAPIPYSCCSFVYDIKIYYILYVLHKYCDFYDDKECNRLWCYCYDAVFWSHAKPGCIPNPLCSDTSIHPDLFTNLGMSISTQCCVKCFAYNLILI